MNNYVEIKQIANKYAQSFKVKEGVKNAVGFEGEFTAFPSSFRSYAIGKTASGRFITGLEVGTTDAEKEIEQNKKKELESILGVDLSDTSSFWNDFFMRFKLPAGTMKLQLDKPDEYIMYKAAIANKILAPNKDFIVENSENYEDMVFYVHDVQAEEKRKATLQQIKDEISSLMYNMRNNQERLFLLCANKKKMVTDKFKAETLYAVLNAEKEALKSNEQLERFRNYLKQSNEVLQADYYVNKGYEKQVIKLNAERQYTYKGTELGNTLDKVKEFLVKPENQEIIVLIQLDLEELNRNTVK